MDRVSFAKNFPADKAIPSELWQLFQYQEEISSAYSGHFHLQDDLWDLPFEDSLRPYLVRFACDADGSFYAFWLYNDLPLESTPVVFLSFGGKSNTILANSFREFLSLLSLGIVELGYSVQEDPNWSRRRSAQIEVSQFREWLVRRLGVNPPKNPQEVIESAKRDHPDLGNWIAEQRSRDQRANDR